MWTVRLSDQQRDALRLLLRTQGSLPAQLAGVLEALELARWDELPDAVLPWDHVTALAALQGIDEADVVWDLAAGLCMRQAGAPAGPPHSAAPER